jgi:hypothetical protein
MFSRRSLFSAVAGLAAAAPGVAKATQSKAARGDGPVLPLQPIAPPTRPTFKELTDRYFPVNPMRRLGLPTVPINGTTIMPSADKDWSDTILFPDEKGLDTKETARKCIQELLLKAGVKVSLREAGIVRSFVMNLHWVDTGAIFRFCENKICCGDDFECWDSSVYKVADQPDAYLRRRRPASWIKEWQDAGDAQRFPNAEIWDPDCERLGHLLAEAGVKVDLRRVRMVQTFILQIYSAADGFLQFHSDGATTFWPNDLFEIKYQRQEDAAAAAERGRAWQAWAEKVVGEAKWYL